MGETGRLLVHLRLLHVDAKLVLCLLGRAFVREIALRLSQPLKLSRPQCNLSTGLAIPAIPAQATHCPQIVLSVIYTINTYSRYLVRSTG